jgi:hypothetical protein
MFSADFLANAIIWAWINKTLGRVIAVVVIVSWVVVDLALRGFYVPLLIVGCLGILIVMAVRHAFRRQARLQAWRDTPFPWPPRSPEGRTEPRLYPAVVTQRTGPQADPASRWPVSRA